jgi:hypothetical protein
VKRKKERRSELVESFILFEWIAEKLKKRESRVTFSLQLFYKKERYFLESKDSL